jgi:glycosyltransferase involved in cell wall biosynthesis
VSTVDVVVPCYNYAHYLQQCISSVLSQRDAEVRVLIVDDCSPDNTPEIATRLAAADKRVSYVRNHKNLGLIGASNRGMIDWTEATYSLLLSADDALTPGALARATRVLDAHPNVGFVHGGAIIFAETPPAPVEPDAFDYCVTGGAQLIQEILRHGNHIPSPTALVRTEIQKRVGSYNEITRHTSDMDMWLRFAAHADVAAIRAPQACYRVHAANMSNIFTADPCKDAEQRIRAAEEALMAVGDRVPGMAGWVGELKQREVENACWRAGLAYEIGQRKVGDAYLAFAAATDPARRNTKLWRSAAIKRLLGGNLLHAMRSVSGKTYNRSQIEDQLRPKDGLAQGTIWGWWPETCSVKTYAGRPELSET